MMTNELRSKTDGILRLMKRCGKRMLEARETMRSSDVTDKEGPGNFVTRFDLEIQETLISELSKVFPDAYFFAEEKENSEEEFKRGLAFLIDPIDGTTNFIHDLHASVVSVGLYEDGEPLFGAVYDPYMDEMYAACRGEGATLNGRPIRVSERKMQKALVAFGSSPYLDRELSARFFSLLHTVFLQCADIRRGGSAALDLCSVASGRIDAFFEEQLSPWDYGAGLLILKEAGGTITDFSGNDIKIGQKSSVVCGGASLHGKLLQQIDELYWR